MDAVSDVFPSFSLIASHGKRFWSSILKSANDYWSNWTRYNFVGFYLPIFWMTYSVNIWIETRNKLACYCRKHCDNGCQKRFIPICTHQSHNTVETKDFWINSIFPFCFLRFRKLPIWCPSCWKSERFSFKNVKLDSNTYRKQTRSKSLLQPWRCEFQQLMCHFHFDSIAVMPHSFSLLDLLILFHVRKRVYKFDCSRI